MQDLSSKLAGCTIFSGLDIVKSNYQVSVADADIPKTGIITPFGLYEYIFMPFGLKNAVQSFQRLMDRLLADIPHTIIYLCRHHSHWHPERGFPHGGPQSSVRSFGL